MQEPIKKPILNISDIMEDASEAFFAKVVEHMPLAQYGDVEPVETFSWENATEQIIRHWWSMNASEHYDLREGN